MHFHDTVPIAIDGLGHIAVISTSETLQFAIVKAEPLSILPLGGEMEEESFYGFRRVTDRALEVLEMELLLGQPSMPIFVVTLQADSHSLFLGELSERGGSMGVVALEAEPVTNLGVFALVIVVYNLFMALSTVDGAQSLWMGDILNIGMAIDTLQFTVDRGTKLSIIHKESKLPLSDLLFFRGRNYHLEPFFFAQGENIRGPMAFETCFIIEGKSHASPHKKAQRH